MIITNLLGRKVQYGGTIVAIYSDRGEVKLVIENADGMLYETNISAVRLINETNTSE